MIVLNEDTIQRSRASWHKDEKINKRQALLLAKDVEATRHRLISAAMAIRFGPDHAKRKDIKFCLTRDDKGVNWLAYILPGQKRPTALCLYTEPRTRTEGYHIVCEWHFKALDIAQN